MSAPLWLRTSTEKKNLKNSQIKNYSCQNRRDKLLENEQVNIDLQEKLFGVINDNAKLKSENSVLRSEIEELQIQNDDLVNNLEANKVKFQNDFNDLHNEIKMNETNLLENNKRCMQQRTKLVEEIDELKSENEKLKLSIANKETEFTKKMKNLESEMKLLQLNYQTVKTQNEENSQKSSKYKNKLKYAITIINDLNNMLIECTAKPELSNSETQTGNERSNHHLNQDSHNSLNMSLQQTNFENENLLLSDIFFKSKAFCDKELLLFAEKKSSLNFDET